MGGRSPQVGGESGVRSAGLAIFFCIKRKHHVPEAGENSMSSPKGLLIFVPTYNEAENVEALYARISKLKLPADILFLDDNSPDGTGGIINRIAAQDQRVQTLHRSGKLGIGSAHATGIRWAYEHDYTYLLTMDCDFTHSPDRIPDFLAELDKYDVIVGSRYLHADSLSTWNPWRKMLTRIGHLLTTTLLRMPYDATGAFRLYRLDRIPAGVFDLVSSYGTTCTCPIKLYSFSFTE